MNEDDLEVRSKLYAIAMEQLTDLSHNVDRIKSPTTDMGRWKLWRDHVARIEERIREVRISLGEECAKEVRKKVQVLNNEMNNSTGKHFCTDVDMEPHVKVILLESLEYVLSETQRINKEIKIKNEKS